VAQGKIKLKPVTAADRHTMPHYEVAEDVDPWPCCRPSGRRTTGTV
jgi:hypothetical protein